MKNTRKKMLLSSVAMLLVALIALGSATFAWYITNARVDAETSQFSASAATGLVIRHKTTDDWGNKITDLETKDNLTPASFNIPSSYSNLVGATGNGTSFSDGTLSGDLSEQTVENGSYFLVDSFYVASSGGSAQDATMHLTASTVAGTYMNIAIYVGGTLQGVYTSDNDASSTSKVTSSTGVTPMTYTSGQSLTKLNNNTVGGTFSFPSKDAGNGTEINIVAYTDGFNSKCKNSTAYTGNVSVKYYFTTA